MSPKLHERMHECLFQQKQYHSCSPQSMVLLHSYNDTRVAIISIAHDVYKLHCYQQKYHYHYQIPPPEEEKMLKSVCITCVLWL